MKKVSVSLRLPPLLAEKVRQIADKHHNRDRTSALIRLIELGVQALEEGKELDEPKYDLEENIILAISSEASDTVRKEMEYYRLAINELRTRLEVVEDKTSKRKKNTD